MLSRSSKASTLANKALRTQKAMLMKGTSTMVAASIKTNFKIETAQTQQRFISKKMNNVWIQPNNNQTRGYATLPKGGKWISSSSLWNNLFNTTLYD